MFLPTINNLILVLLEEDTMKQFEKWRYMREKDSEEFQQTMGQVIKDMGVRLRDTIDRMYDK